MYCLMLRLFFYFVFCLSFGDSERIFKLITIGCDITYHDDLIMVETKEMSSDLNSSEMGGLPLVINWCFHLSRL